MQSFRLFDLMAPELQSKLGDWLSERTGQKFTPLSSRSVSGGCIHQSYILDGGERSYFVKLNRATERPVFEAEREALEAIHQSTSIRVPRAIGCGSFENQSFLAMERLCFGRPGSHSWQEMGAQLAALHRSTADQFGWPSANYIGASPQQNHWTGNWSEFFREQRLRPQLKMANQAGIHLRKRDALFDAAEAILGEHRTEPSLLHGDLWSGNAGFLQDGSPVVYDLASYYGDREADLAFSEFFGGFPGAFYQAYLAAWPLPAGYERRKILYNLYHVLNHANLFGGGYVSQAQGMIDELVRM